MLKSPSQLIKIKVEGAKENQQIHHIWEARTSGSEGIFADKWLEKLSQI